MSAPNKLGPLPQWSIHNQSLVARSKRLDPATLRSIVARKEVRQYFSAIPYAPRSATEIGTAVHGELEQRFGSRTLTSEGRAAWIDGIGAAAGLSALLIWMHTPPMVQRRIADVTDAYRRGADAQREGRRRRDADPLEECEGCFDRVPRSDLRGVDGDLNSALWCSRCRAENEDA